MDSLSFVCPRCSTELPRGEFLYRADGRPRYCRACGQANYQDNREARIAATLRWQRENPEKNRAKNRAHYEANTERLKAYGAAYGKRWHQENRERSYARTLRRRERLSNVAKVKYTEDQLRGRWDYYGGRCWMCGAEASEMDHVKPILHGGPDMLANLRPACDPCNSGKGWKWPVHTHVHGTVRSALRPERVDYIPFREIVRG